MAEEKEFAITCNGKRGTPLSANSENRLKESLDPVRRARAQAAVAAIQDASLRSGTHRMSLEEINAEIDAARKETNGS